MSGEGSMVERVARILEPQAWRVLGLTFDTLAYENRRKSSLRKARAAVQAVRESDAARTVSLSSETILGALRFDAGTYEFRRVDAANAGEPPF